MHVTAANPPLLYRAFIPFPSYEQCAATTKHDLPARRREWLRPNYAKVEHRLELHVAHQLLLVRNETNSGVIELEGGAGAYGACQLVIHQVSGVHMNGGG